MKLAFSLLPDRFEDGRHTAMENGLRAVGYRVERGAGKPQSPDDAMITWNIHSGRERTAREFEAAGGRVIVAEEAYFRAVNGEKHFALALGGHNGAGRWNVGGPERWERFGVPLAPWREEGTHVIVRGQRGIGSSEMASPPNWHETMAARLRGFTKRPIVIRLHHKLRNEPVGHGLDHALKDCHAVVTWASSIAPRALAKGCPVFICAPRSIALACSAGRLPDDIEKPARPDRLPMFERLAWAQWGMSELASGAAFDHLLRVR